MLDRPNIGRHLAFGAGPHRCAGAPLATLMLRVTLDELLARTSSIELAGEVTMTGWPEWGTLSVPTVLTAARAVVTPPTSTRSPTTSSRDPHATWARLRAECPVARGARWDFWALTRYDDIVAASSRPADFTSSLGIVVPKNPVSGRRAPLHFDPPEHPRYRRPLNAVLRARSGVPALEPAMRELASELVAAFVAAGGGEFVGEVSSPYAGLVFAEILHLPRDYARELNASGERFEHAQAHFDVETAERENQHLYAECRKIVADAEGGAARPRRGSRQRAARGAGRRRAARGRVRRRQPAPAPDRRPRRADGAARERRRPPGAEPGAAGAAARRARR